MRPAPRLPTSKPWPAGAKPRCGWLAGLSLLLLAPAAGAQCPAPQALEWTVAEEADVPPSLYIQGFEIGPQGQWWLSGGGYGDSRLIQWQQGEVLKEWQPGPSFFAEGLSRRQDRIWMLSWRAGTAWELSADKLELQAIHHYSGQGWGLAWSEKRQAFLMSNGSDRLQWRSAEDFSALASLPVRRMDQPQPRLNELEVDGDQVWANIWYSDSIVRIDLDSGCVTAELDLRSLWREQPRPRRAEVLNGIALDPATGLLWVSGKRWGKAFGLRLGAD